MIDIHQYQLDQLIQLDNSSTGDKCIIRYIGEINIGTIDKPHLSHDYIGVEWIVPNRGKHNGTHNTTQYFISTTFNCSFIRIERILHNSTIHDILIQKYINNSTAYTNSINDNKYEFKGEQLYQLQFSNLNRLSIINIAELQCNNTQCDGLEEMIGGVHEIDLTNNLITEYNYIAQFHKLQKLSILNLSKNYICTNHIHQFHSKQFISLHTLIMNDMLLDESRLLNNIISVLELNCMPSLRHIILIRNHIQYIINHDITNQRLIDSLQYIETLDLSNNNITSDVVSNILNQLTNLTKLILSCNQLSSLHYTTGYHTLTYLSLDNNQLSALCCIDQLNQLPVLTHLNIRNNRYYNEHINLYFQWYDSHPHHTVTHDSTTESTSENTDIRYELISRLSKLQYLNNSFISDKTRTAAEIYYVRNAIYMYNTIYTVQYNNMSQQKSIQHYYVRYDELCIKYNDIIQNDINNNDKTKNINTTNTNLSTTVYTIHIIYLLQCNCTQYNTIQHKQITKNIPNSITINKLRLLLGKLLSIRSNVQYYMRYNNTCYYNTSQLIDDKLYHKSLIDMHISNESTIWIIPNKQCTCLNGVQT